MATDWKTIICCAVAVVAMLIFMFRLDELIARNRSGQRREKRLVGRNPTGETMHTDPDGRPWKRSQRR